VGGFAQCEDPVIRREELSAVTRRARGREDGGGALAAWGTEAAEWRLWAWRWFMERCYRLGSRAIGYRRIAGAGVARHGNTAKVE